MLYVYKLHIKHFLFMNTAVSKLIEQQMQTEQVKN